MPNAFLPKKTHEVGRRSLKGIPTPPCFDAELLSPRDLAASNSKKSNRGRKPKKFYELDRQMLELTPLQGEIFFRGNAEVGLLKVEWGRFLYHYSSQWGTSPDMFALAHGAVGCGAFALTERLNLPGLIQGIESFSALHACSNLTSDDLEDGGNRRLARAVDEAHELFPLAKGIGIFNEEPIGHLGTNVQQMIKAKTAQFRLPVIAPTYGMPATEPAAFKATFRTISQFGIRAKKQSYDVALLNLTSISDRPEHQPKAPAHIWIISKLLREIGLNPVHPHSGSSADDLARIPHAKLIIKPLETILTSCPQDWLGYGLNLSYLQTLFGTPLVWTCFASPSATDASLRAIAAHFDQKIQDRTEAVIAANRKKVDAVIARYKPRLRGKLFVKLEPGWTFFTKEMLEPFHLLGMRVGNDKGWPSKTGIRHTPQITPKPWDEKSQASYIAESKPDLIYADHHDTYDWHKRGLASLPTGAVFDGRFGGCFGYDGFALLAAALDRHINAPWRKLVKPPWPPASG